MNFAGGETMAKCPFCGSKELKLETPYIRPSTGKHETRWCCKSQAENNKYREKRFSPYDDNKPELEDISKL